MIEKKDHILIESNKCEEEDCKEQGYGIANNKFLCKYHFRLIVPPKEKKMQLTKGLLGKTQN